MSHKYSTADAYQQGYPADGTVQYGENGTTSMMQQQQQQQPPDATGAGSATSVGSIGATSSSGSSSGSGSGSGGSGSTSTSFDDPRIADLPRILLMGPRRGGKTSIQVS